MIRSFLRSQHRVFAWCFDVITLKKNYPNMRKRFSVEIEICDEVKVSGVLGVAQ